MRRWVFLAVGLLMATTALTVVEASHTYGHRYVVMGRIVDADGTPFQQKTVTISTWLGETKQAEMAVTTDCNGDYYSPEGQASPPGARYNYIEGPNAAQETYFHYHDSDLTSRIEVRFAAGNDTWTGPFNPDTRYTFSRHRMSESFDAAPGCAETASENQFTAHVWMGTDSEMKTGEDVINPRLVNVTLNAGGSSTTLNGTTDSNGNIWLTFQNVTVSAGDSFVVSSEFLRSDRTVTLTADDADFRTADVRYVVDASDSGGIGAGLRTFLIVLAVIVVIVLGYLGFQKMQERRELKRAYGSSERRRARRKS